MSVSASAPSAALRALLAACTSASLLGAWAMGCTRDVGGHGDAGPPGAPARAASAADAAPSRAPSSDALTCRLTSVHGRGTVGAVRDGGVSAEGGAARDAIEESFIDRLEELVLEPDAGATITRALSGRELRVLGPAHLVPCVVDGVSWLYEGAVDSVPSSGAAPGRTSAVVTPAAVVRWAAAQVRVQVTRSSGTTVTVSSGSVQVRALAPDGGRASNDGGPPGFEELAAPATRTYRASSRAEAASVAQCTSRIATVRSLTRAVLHPSATRERAAGAGADLVSAQELMRADCAMAELLATRRGDGAALAALAAAHSLGSRFF